ncbi:hypothetical protein Ddye_001053 [Dipteronia dyeriana]|uniref:FAE domain-containing protein n=1 Tax=Dipteronia dyeriana TaxID=168575 RepID=A0AAD9XMW4_9ROSI|nr:hypothetical protein Ddye_001053 [Dipteronia dyeriana]
MVLSLFTYFSLPNSSTMAETPISLIHLFASFVMIFTVAYYSLRCKRVYLVDFTCYLPADSLRTPISNFIEHLEKCNVFNRESLDFHVKVSERSGIGNEARVPISIHALPPDSTLNASREETTQVMFTVFNDLLSKHNINPKSIDVLVSNCSLFCLSPSITTMIIN